MSSAESSAQKSTANGPSIKHLTKARVISVCSPAATAQPSQSSPEETNQPHKNPRHETSSSSSTSLSSAPSAAAFVIANNEDLLTQILLYLPPKSLLRFQCVSKGWLSIISSPSFRSLHSRVYPTTTSSSAATKGLFLFRRRTWTDIPDLNFISFSDDYVNSMGNIVCHLSNYGKFTDIHSCNGLLALAFMLDDYAREFVVCNPTTRQHRLVPRLDFQEGGREFLALNIVFDPLKSEHYKLVCAWCEQEMITNNFGQLVPSDFHGFSVYASEKGSWRDSEDILEMEDLYLPNYFRNGVLWNGNFHWVSDFEYCLCFDPDKEFFNLTMPLARWYFWSFGESGGCLYGIEINDPEAMLFDIFEMARDYSQWVLKCHVDLTPVTTLYPSMIDADCNPATDFRFNFHILYFLEDEKENRMRLLISLCGKIILYDINDKIVKELAEVVPKDTDGDWWDSCFRWRDTYRHMETLATL